MSLLTYNGISLPFCTVKDFRCEAIADESDTDHIVTEFDITVLTVVSADSPDLLDPDTLIEGRTDSPADFMSGLHQRLMARRKTLSFKFADVEFIPNTAGVNGTVDAMNGPKPKHCHIVPLGESSWMVTYRIVARYRVNYRVNDNGSVIYTNLPGNVVLSNRWRESVGIDSRNYSLKTRSGKIMIRSDNDKGWMADQVRLQMATCGVPPGFVRESAEYTVDETGLGLQYTIRDAEVFRMPPAPALRADGEYEEEGTRGDGKRYGFVRIRLEGDKATEYPRLASTCCAIAAGKLALEQADIGPGGKGLLESCRVRVGLYDMWVEVSMRALYPARQERVAGAAFLSPSLCYVPNSSGTQPPSLHKGRGTAGLLLQAACYYDPDLRGTVLANGTDQFINEGLTPTGPGRGQLSQGHRPGEAGKFPEG